VNFQLDKNSVCIFYKFTQDGARKAFGTGFFFMENDLVATARHIMEDHANAREPYTLLVRPSQSYEGCFAVQCLYHVEQDLALVKLERSYPVVPFRPCFETKEGFVLLGYDPPSETIAVRPVPRFYKPEPWEGKQSTTFFFEWDGPVNPGNSGGPLIGTDGGVAGILSGVSRQVESSEDTSQAAGRARAVFIGPLMDLYARWKSDPTSIKTIDVPFT
jgi:Trypsin-like peptidase domain